MHGKVQADAQGDGAAPGLGPVLPRVQAHQQAAAHADCAGAAVCGACSRPSSGKRRQPGLFRNHAGLRDSSSRCHVPTLEVCRQVQHLTLAFKEESGRDWQLQGHLRLLRGWQVLQHRWSSQGLSLPCKKRVHCAQHHTPEASGWSWQCCTCTWPPCRAPDASCAWCQLCKARCSSCSRMPKSPHGAWKVISEVGF